MKTQVFLCQLAAALALGLSVQAAQPELETVASFPGQQVTGVAVSKSSRVFVNFPFWSDDHTTSVAEVLPDGSWKPYPTAEWNAKEGPVEKRWVCVQSVVVDDSNALWVLDPASPKIEGVVKGGAKLVRFNLETDLPVQTFSFDASIAPEKSYLNDVRVDTQSGHAFITESGVGALIVVDLKTGKARRVLENHPSTKAEKGAEIAVDGMKLIDPKTGSAPEFHADGIALDQENGWLYYHALTGSTMYRIKTEHLRNASLSDQQLADKVEKLGTTPKPDGMLEGKNATIYLAALEMNAIVRFNAETRETTTVVQDDRLQWPDSLAWGPDGRLYVTTSQIHRMPRFHGGESKQKGPYAVYRLKVP